MYFGSRLSVKFASKYQLYLSVCFLCELLLLFGVHYAYYDVSVVYCLTHILNYNDITFVNFLPDGLNPTVHVLNCHGFHIQVNINKKRSHGFQTRQRIL